MVQQMEKGAVMKKRFCKQLEGTDAAVFSVMDQAFLFSGNTLTYFPLTDFATDMFLSGDYKSEWKDEFIEKYSPKYSEKEIRTTFEKFAEFFKSGVLIPAKLDEKPNLHFKDYYLKLVQSTRCNLHCGYCFSRKSAEFDMSVETAKKTILQFVDEFVPKTDGEKRYIIDLTGSGEPLLRLDFILEVNDFVLQLKKERNINIFCQLATNGMLLSKKVSSLLKKKCILFGVSLDGAKDVSEKNRAGLNYDLVSKNIREMENKDFFGLAATYSGNNHDFINIFKTLLAFGPEVVGMKPVRLSEDNPNSINKNNIEEIKNSYDRFAKWLYKQLVSGNSSNRNSSNGNAPQKNPKKNEVFNAFAASEDYFARFLKITLHPLRLFYRCSAGVNAYAVDGKENIIICPAFIGKEEGIIGNLNTGIFPEKKAILENMYADKIEKCKSCWARYTCGGECFAVSQQSGGKIGEPNETMCELKKYLIQLSVYFWTALRFSHEDIYQECLKKY